MLNVEHFQTLTHTQIKKNMREYGEQEQRAFLLMISPHSVSHNISMDNIHSYTHST